MRRRRVGVTARLRQIVGTQATGSGQIATEMAAPLELRTPMGTAARSRRVRMEVWRPWRGSELAGRRNQAAEASGYDNGPLSCRFILPGGGCLSRVRKPRKRRAPLTGNLPPERVLR